MLAKEAAEDFIRELRKKLADGPPPWKRRKVEPKSEGTLWKLRPTQKGVEIETDPTIRVAVIQALRGKKIPYKLRRKGVIFVRRS